MLRLVALLERMERATTARERDEATATFLTLRLLEQWLALGALLASPKGRAHAAATAAVKRVATPEVAEPLRFILRGVLMLRDPDAQPFLRRVYGLGESLEGEGAFAAAGECYGLVTRHGTMDDPILVDARIRRAFCHLQVGESQWAELEFHRASAMAATTRDEWRMLVARIGLAKVLLATGRVRAADVLMEEVARRFDRRSAPPREPRRAARRAPRKKR